VEGILQLQYNSRLKLILIFLHALIMKIFQGTMEQKHLATKHNDGYISFNSKDGQNDDKVIIKYPQKCFCSYS